MKWVKLLVVLLLFASAGRAQIAAFPGAQGGGAASKGGRGGVVYEITSLADTGGSCTATSAGFTNCTLRQCLQGSGARTCIFRVSGLITSLSRLSVPNPFVTIAGQTAPGGGIVLGGPNQQGEQFDVQTHDVIARYLTYDGNSPRPTGPDTGTVGFEEALGLSTSVYNVIFDHLTGRWQGNKFLLYANDISGNTAIYNSVWQWCLFYEPNINHPVGPLMSAIAFPSHDVNNDWHHNLFMNMGHRIPLVAPMQNWRWVNNLTFNWDYFASNQDGSSSDFIGNLWIAGNLNGSNSNPHPINATLGTGGGAGNCLQNCDLPGTPSIYMIGNIGPQGTDYQLTAEEAGTDPEGFPEVASPIRAGWRRATPLAAEQFPIVPDQASALPTILPATVGNSRHLDCNGNFVANRDSQDTRVINQFTARGPGGEFAGPNYNGPTSGPAVPAGTPCQESMHDGIPDQWKIANGYSATDPNIRNQVTSSGYTVLETYLNGTGTTTGGGGGGGTPPAILIISSVSVSNITATGATVTWTTNNPSNSTVVFGPCDVSLSSPTNQTLVTSHSVILTGLSSSTQYNFSAESFDGTTTLMSPTGQFTTLAAPGGGGISTPLPVVLSATSTGIQITWSPSQSTGVTSYKIYRSGTSGSGFVQKGQVSGTTFVDTAVTSGQTLFYVVTAIAPGDTTPESAFSNQIQVVVP